MWAVLLAVCLTVLGSVPNAVAFSECVQARPLVEFDRTGYLVGPDHMIMVEMRTRNEDACSCAGDGWMIEGHTGSGGSNACKYDQAGFFEPLFLETGQSHRRYLTARILSTPPCLFWMTGEIWRRSAFPNAEPNFPDDGKDSDFDVIPVYVDVLQ
jgi:hypothetical protein